jgi:hypothetical protein
LWPGITELQEGALMRTTNQDVSDGVIGLVVVLVIVGIGLYVWWGRRGRD